MNSPLLTRAATTAAAALLSRILGLVRDMCTAWLLGGGATADLLAQSLRLPVLARRLLAEGTLSMSLTASFSRLAPEKLSPSNLAPLSRLAVSTGSRLLAFLACFVLLGEIFAEPFFALLAPGLTQQPESAREGALLLRICLPYLCFAGAAAAAMALLHSLHRFFLPSASSAFFNLTVTAFAGLAVLLPVEPARLLALGVVCGGAVQCMAQAFALHKLGIRFFLPRNTETDTPQARQSLLRLPAGLLGAAAPQLALLCAGALASRLSVGGAAALYYAERILEFPLGLTGAALGMASLPALTTYAAARDTGKTREEAGSALRLALCISLPAAAGLAAAAEPIIRVCFFRGAFDTDALAAASAALAAYAPALPAYAASRPLLALANAENRTRLTALSSCVAVPLAALTGLALLPAGIIGPPLGFGIGIWTQVLVLRFGLRRYVPPLPLSALFRYGAGSALVFATARLILALLPESPLTLLPAVALPTALYVLWLLILGDNDLPRLLKCRPRKNA